MSYVVSKDQARGGEFHFRVFLNGSWIGSFPTKRLADFFCKAHKAAVTL